MIKRFYVSRDEGCTVFDTVTRCCDASIIWEHDNHTCQDIDNGNGRWTGGAGYLAFPDTFFTEMEESRVSKVDFDIIWQQCLAKE